MRRRERVAAGVIVLGAVFLPLIMTLGIGVGILIWRALAG